MPLSARRQAQRRIDRKLFGPPKNLPRKKCVNCDKPFGQTRKDQKFCGGTCRREFHANGGNAFGPLKGRLEKMIAEHTGQLQKEMRQARKDVDNLTQMVAGLLRDELHGTANGNLIEAGRHAGGKG